MMTNDTFQCLTGQFLIAMPSLAEGIFKSSLTYICEHNDKGAMGIIINRPLELELGDILEAADITLDIDSIDNHANSGTRVMAGGPVGQNRGFVLHEREVDKQWESSMQINESVCLTGSKDILEAIYCGRGPQKFIVSLGYAGWSSSQLEEELADNLWINVPANNAILFDVPIHQRTEQAAKLLGIEMSRVANYAGTA